MFSNKKLAIICDIKTVTDPKTLDKKKVVENVKKVICDKDLVGVQTQQLAQLQNMVFAYSLVVDRMFYTNQKYIYLENILYKIQSVGKARLPKDCTLNVIEFDDFDIKNAIEEWLDEDI